MKIYTVYKREVQDWDFGSNLGPPERISGHMTPEKAEAAKKKIQRKLGNGYSIRVEEEEVEE